MNIPGATYRLQFNRQFPFSDASAVLPYLAQLGIDCLYASPIFHARSGSMHGYDIVDPNALNPELGGSPGFETLARGVQEQGLFWMQDIVPNHMAYDSANELIFDVLENGHASHYIDFFDIEWDHQDDSISGRVLAPFLGTFYGQALEEGQIRLRYEENGLAISYYDLSFPVRIESYAKILTFNLSAFKRRIGADHPDLVKFIVALYSIRNFSQNGNEDGRQRKHHIQFVKRMIWNLYTQNRDIRNFIDTNIKLFNGKTGDTASFTPLDNLLGEQYYRLSFWKVASEELNYRRFFNINDLISLKVEQEEVFTFTHALINRLLNEKKITSLRIDHIDGLYDPLRYTRRLREHAPDAYIIVEKILGLDERLPEQWPVQGTTGYDFLNYVNGLFCRRESEASFTRTFFRMTGFSVPYRDLLFEKKRLIIGKYMAGDVDILARLLKRISSRDRHGRDITLYGLKHRGDIRQKCFQL